MSREGALWIGGLESYMDEDYLGKALNSMGETNILSIKVIKNKFTGQVAGYGFINFANDQIALTAMHKLNGKIMPNSQPPTRFKLNHNSNRLLPGEKNFSIWVGDLSPEIDDHTLYRFFSARFKTIISAKVVLDEAGASKGFGFIRFGNEIEQQTALTSMQGISGLGSKPIKVSIAVQKTKDPSQMSHSMEIPDGITQTITKQLQGQYPDPSGGYSADYYSQYSQYWSQVAAWNQYQQYYGYPDPNAVAPPLPPTPAPGSEGQQGEKEKTENKQEEMSVVASILDGPLNEPVQHNPLIDYEALNRKWLLQSEELFDSIEESGWWLPTEE